MFNCMPRILYKMVFLNDDVEDVNMESEQIVNEVITQLKLNKHTIVISKKYDMAKAFSIQISNIRAIEMIEGNPKVKAVIRNDNPDVII